MEHSRLAPSSAWIRKACAGSLRMSEGLPNEETAQTLEGTLAHRYFNQCLGDENEEIRAGEEITQEMTDGVELVEGWLNSTLARFGETAKVYLNTRVYARDIHIESWGTLDLGVFDSKTSTLIIADYKFGHLFVDVRDNPQLLIYAQGMIETFHLDVQHIEIVIIQPRAYSHPTKIRSQLLTKTEFSRRILELHLSETASTQPDAPCTPSPVCKFCKARTVCNALQNSAVQMIESVQGFQNLLTPEQVNAELQYLERATGIVIAREEAVRSQAKAFLMQGKAMSGYQLKAEYGRKFWQATVQEVKTIASLLGVEKITKEELITPLQAIKAGLPEEVVDSLSTREMGDSKVVPIVAEVEYERLFGTNKGE